MASANSVQLVEISFTVLHTLRRSYAKQHTNARTFFDSVEARLLYVETSSERDRQTIHLKAGFEGLGVCKGDGCL